MRKKHPFSANEWPIHSEYVSANLNSYLEKKLINEPAARISPQQHKELNSLIDELEEPILFLPLGPSRHTFHLLNDAPNMFVEFASSIGSYSKPNDKDILTWLEDYGPLFQKPVNLAKASSTAEELGDDFWQPKNPTEVTYELEYAWYWAFDEYIILKDTIVKLAAVTHNALQLLIALRTGDMDRLEKTIYHSTLNDSIRQNLLSVIGDRDNIRWNELIPLITDNWLLPLVQHYLTGATPSFEYHIGVKKRSSHIPSDEQSAGLRPIKFIRTWMVPDQWRAMWVHFYEQITSDTEFRTCPQCQKLFAVTDNRQTYCPPRPGAKRSRCQNTAAVSEARKEK